MSDCCCLLCSVEYLICLSWDLTARVHSSRIHSLYAFDWSAVDILTTTQTCFISWHKTELKECSSVQFIYICFWYYYNVLPYHISEWIHSFVQTNYTGKLKLKTHFPCVEKLHGLICQSNVLIISSMSFFTTFDWWFCFDDLFFNFHIWYMLMNLIRALLTSIYYLSVICSFQVTFKPPSETHLSYYISLNICLLDKLVIIGH